MSDLLCGVCKHGFYSHGYVQMEKEEGSFVRVEVSEPFGAITALPQALIQQDCMIVETRPSYSEQNKKSLNNRNAKLQARLCEVAH